MSNPSFNKTLPLIKSKNQIEEINLTQNRLSNIKDYLTKIDAENIIKKVDPNMNSLDLIAQIQLYSNRIHGEIEIIKQREYKIDNLYKDLSNIVKHSKEEEETENNNQNQEILNENKDETNEDKGINFEKTIMKVHTREMEIDKKKYNEIRHKNNILSKELNELRKEVLSNEEKVSHLIKEYNKNEDEFEKTRKEHMITSQKLKGYIDNGGFEKIKEKKKVLSRMKEEYSKEVLKIDDVNIQKQCANKHILEEIRRLGVKETKIMEDKRNEEEMFNMKYKKEIEELEDGGHLNKSKLLLEIESEGKEKIIRIEKLNEEIIERTGMRDIKEMIDYLIKSVVEYNNFNKFVVNIQEKAILLEKEVEELDFMINIFERNDKRSSDTNKNNDLNMDDNESSHIKLEVFDEIGKMLVEGEYVYIKDKINDLINDLNKKSKVEYVNIDELIGNIREVSNRLYNTLYVKINLNKSIKKTNSNIGNTVNTNQNIILTTDSGIETPSSNINNYNLDLINTNSTSTVPNAYGINQNLNLLLNHIKDESNLNNEELIYNECSKNVKERVKSSYSNLNDIEKLAKDSALYSIKTYEKSRRKND